MRLFLLIFLLPIISNAKCYVINDAEIICAKGFTPAGSLKDAPLDELSKFVRTFEDIDMIDGVPTYNPTKRAARLAQEATDKSDMDATEAQLVTIRGQLRIAINNVDGSSDAQLRTIVKRILRMMLRETQ